MLHRLVFFSHPFSQPQQRRHQYTAVTDIRIMAREDQTDSDDDHRHYSHRYRNIPAARLMIYM